jgi:hypothetical protein
MIYVRFLAISWFGLNVGKRNSTGIARAAEEFMIKQTNTNLEANTTNIAKLGELEAPFSRRI